MDTVKKKLREARYFLGQLSQRENLAFAEREHFDFYLSAFLCTSRSVDSRLRHIFGTPYRRYYTAWEASLRPQDRRLMKFMIDDRNLEVHEAGSSRSARDKPVRIGRRYEDKSGVMTVTGPPGAAAAIVKVEYTFTLDGQPVPVTECCRDFLSLLDRLVADYERNRGAA